VDAQRRPRRLERGHVGVGPLRALPGHG
jgi:hypothetical protein